MTKAADVVASAALFMNGWEPAMQTDSTVEYRNVKDFPGYRVGSDGTVWTAWINRSGKGAVVGSTWKLLKISRGKYSSCTLTRDGTHYGFLVHRLVLEAFVGPCPPGMEACHFPDRDPHNNSAKNLSWGTPKRNHRHRLIHGTDPTGERNPFAKLTDELASYIRTNYIPYDKFKGGRALAKELGLTPACISLVVKRKSWKHVY
jgi:hypothetical protein